MPTTGTASGPYQGGVADARLLASDPVRNFRFLVKFIPRGTKQLAFDTTVGFVSVSGLNVTTEAIAYREGGYNTTVHQVPGMTTFSPITMSRGVVLGSQQSVNWMKRLFATTAATGNGGIGTDFRCDVEIAVLGHPNATGFTLNDDTDKGIAATDPWSLYIAMRFKVYNAWITNLAYSDLNAGDNALLVEQMTLVHEGWDVNFGKADFSETAKTFDGSSTTATK